MTSFVCAACKEVYPTARRLSSHLGRWKTKDERHGTLWRWYVRMVRNFFREGKSQAELLQSPRYIFGIGFLQTAWKTFSKEERFKHCLDAQAKQKAKIYNLPAVRPTEVQLRNLYETQRMTCQQIADMFKCNRVTIENWVTQLRLSHGRNRPPVVLTDEQKSIIYGTVLGDGHIRDSSLYLCHCKVQEKYLKWKVEKLSPLFDNRQILFRTSTEFLPGQPYKEPVTSCSISSRHHPFLDEVRKEVYDANGQKHITLDILRKLGIAGLSVWYQDDGSRTQDVTMHVCSFDPNEIDLFSMWLFSKYSVLMPRYGKPMKYTISATSFAEAKKFIELTQPYAVLNYKFDVNDLLARRKKYHQ